MFCPIDGFGKMYKWIDQNGQTHFSDTKPNEKEKINGDVKEYEEKYKKKYNGNNIHSNDKYLSDNMPPSQKT